jgi:anaerobic selenocysteine-containing dehydrogenase
MQNNKNTEVKRALCFGCWLQAGVLATVTDGKVVNLRGEPGHPEPSPLDRCCVKFIR